MSRAIKDKHSEDYSIRELSSTEARRIFDKAVLTAFGISAKEFIDNYRAGRYENRDDCDLMSVLMLLPFTGYSAEYGK